ncbi:MAG: transcriptional regulator [Epulopiscium sp. Nuni2H_MBin003]|nr:MAG: transcriptional regulator [Epulopiscium sp. Nuni2H_MBin003]
MSGHSKFANIKHKKAKNDAQKGKIFTKIGREIAVAVKNGGSDPNLNNKLKDIIAKAKSNNMPNDTIARSIKKAEGDATGASYEYITYEGYGPNGIAVIVETLTDNKNRTAANVRAAFSKGNGNMGTTGCVSFMFEKKGEIIIEKEENDIDEDDLMMLALDAGADDFNSEYEGYVITSSPETFSDVYKALEDANIKISEGQIAMIPTTNAQITDDNIKAFNKMMDLLENDDDVQEVYHNCNNYDE